VEAVRFLPACRELGVCVWGSACLEETSSFTSKQPLCLPFTEILTSFVDVFPNTPST
jgi:hypothetical protein